MIFGSSKSSCIRNFCSFFSDRYLNPSFVRFTAITIIVFGILNLAIAFLTSSDGRNIYGSWAGGDYSCFYIAGKILNDYPPERLYDFRLHSELLHSLLPGISSNEHMPYINPPFFALIFKPLSHLHFMVSYFIWILATVILYVLAFMLLWKTLESMPPKTLSIALLLAISFEPFLMEDVLGGNTAVVGFFACALFLFFRHSKKEILSGLSLGILLYKPTFLLLILPMLVLARRTKILLGFSICGVVLVLISLLTVGYDTCVNYAQFLLGVSSSALGSEEIFRTWKYVDIFSFIHLLLGNVSPKCSLVIILVFLVPIMYSVNLWWKINNLSKSCQDLLIASAITLTSIINLHFAIYDSVILTLSILLTANVLFRNSLIHNSIELPIGFKVLLVSIFIIPWLSQQLARIIGLQLVTIAIAVMGTYQIVLARNYSKEHCHL